jgi:hypothetical protein
MGYIFGVAARRSHRTPPAPNPHADVAELVDALVSGTSGSNVVGVQVSPSALRSSSPGKSFFIDDPWATRPFLASVGVVRLPRPPAMLVLKISNASEVVASKLGKFLEALTPDSFDQNTIEDVLIKELIKNLQAEGLKGEVAAVRGLDLEGNQMVVREGLQVRRHQAF